MFSTNSGMFEKVEVDLTFNDCRGESVSRLFCFCNHWPVNSPSESAGYGGKRTAGSSESIFGNGWRPRGELSRAGKHDTAIRGTVVESSPCGSVDLGQRRTATNRACAGTRFEGRWPVRSSLNRRSASGAASRGGSPPWEHNTGSRGAAGSAES
jgi:hypothetical protein